MMTPRTYYLEIGGRPVILDGNGKPDLGELGQKSIGLNSRQVSLARSLFQRYGIDPRCCCSFTRDHEPS